MKREELIAAELRRRHGEVLKMTSGMGSLRASYYDGCEDTLRQMIDFIEEMPTDPTSITTRTLSAENDALRESHPAVVEQARREGFNSGLSHAACEVQSQGHTELADELMAMVDDEYATGSQPDRSEPIPTRADIEREVRAKIVAELRAEQTKREKDADASFSGDDYSGCLRCERAARGWRFAADHVERMGREEIAAFTPKSHTGATTARTSPGADAP